MNLIFYYTFLHNIIIHVFLFKPNHQNTLPGFYLKIMVQTVVPLMSH